eukprot:4116110-Alexandrium_andersonii.AAC.1
MSASLVGSEMCIRDRYSMLGPHGPAPWAGGVQSPCLESFIRMSVLMMLCPRRAPLQWPVSRTGEG